MTSRACYKPCSPANGGACEMGEACRSIGADAGGKPQFGCTPAPTMAAVDVAGWENDGFNDPVSTPP